MTRSTVANPCWPAASESVTYAHDASSRLTGVAQATQADALAYDPASRRTSLVLPNGITVTYTYDGNGNLATVTDRKNQVTTHSYDPTNRRTRTEYADGSSVSFGDRRTTGGQRRRGDEAQEQGGDDEPQRRWGGPPHS